MTLTTARRIAVLMSKRRQYWRKIYNLARANMIGFWRQNETAGAVSVDSSPEGNDGAYTGVDLANAAGPDGVFVPFWDGTNDYNNIQSVGLAADINVQEGTMMLWMRPFDAGVWTDGAIRWIMRVYRNADNYVEILKWSTNNQLIWRYKAAGVEKLRSSLTHNLTPWQLLTITWSLSAGATGEVRAYSNGVQVGATMDNLGTWNPANTPTISIIGAQTLVPANVWHGWLGPGLIWNIPLTPAQVLEAATI